MSGAATDWNHEILAADSPERIREAVRNGANPDTLDTNKTPVLLRQTKPECIQALIESGANRDAVDFWGDSLLHILAAYMNRNASTFTQIYKAAEKAVEMGCDTNILNKNGENPLHVIAAMDLGIGSLLVRSGTRLDQENYEGVQAWQSWIDTMWPGSEGRRNALQTTLDAIGPNAMAFNLASGNWFNTERVPAWVTAANTADAAIFAAHADADLEIAWAERVHDPHVRQHYMDALVRKIKDGIKLEDANPRKSDGREWTGTKDALAGSMGKPLGGNRP